MCSQLLLPLFLIAIAAGCSQAGQDEAFTFGGKVLAPTVYGLIEGFRHTTANGTQANVYLGVPYAQPPVGNLRFERPVPPKFWFKPLETKTFKSPCIPYIQTGMRKNVSEDCLYLNIITPTKPAKNPLKGYPVLFYVHGGGFVMEDAVRLGYDKAAENYVKRGMIVVTIQYRIGFFGFMSLGTDEDPGNMGLWDQTAALKFVKQNIRFFGGNPNNIVVWGESAGSQAVDLLSISPASRNLFQKAIQASGASALYTCTGIPVTKATLRFAKAIGCPYEGPAAAIKSCLQSKPWESILAVSNNISIAVYVKESLYNIGFGPRYDKDFFGGKTIEQLIAEAPPKPLILGLNTMEGASFSGLRGASAATLSKFSSQNISDLITNTFVTETLAGPEYLAIQEDIINFFSTHDAPENATADYYVKQFVDFWGDWIVYQGSFNSTDLKVQRGWPVYMYNWNHLTAPVQTSLPQAVGGWHAYELAYTFDYLTYPGDVHGPTEFQIQNIYADIFAQFAHTGNPQTQTIPFPRYNLVTRQSLWIDATPSIVSDYIGDRRRFWIEHVGKFNYDVIRGRTREQILNPESLD